jgi:predicted nucleic acid-binding protein
MNVFLDANILFAAAGSVAGGSRELFHIAEHDREWNVYSSIYADEEARRNLKKKYPAALPDLDALSKSASLIIVQQPHTTLIQACAQIINEKDAPILAAAISMRADALCTFDRKDFHVQTVMRWCAERRLRIVTPQMLVQEWDALHT